VSSDSDKPTRPGGHGRHGRTKKVWWKRPLTWAGGIVTITITAIATAFGTGLGQELSNTVTGTSGPVSSPTEREVSASAAHPVPTVSPKRPMNSGKSQSPPPLIIEDVSAGFANDLSFMSPQKVAFTKKQLANFNKTSDGFLNTELPAGDVIENLEFITITVAGNSREPVTIDDMEVVRQCQKPLVDGTLFYSPYDGGGSYEAPTIYFNLDRPLAVGQYIPGVTGGTLGGNYFATQVTTLRMGEPQTFKIYVTTMRQYCTFTFRVSVATANGLVYQTITNNGKPFAITTDSELLSSPDPRLVMPGNPDYIKFSSYSVVYAGGLADRQHNLVFIRVNPATYHGIGDPTEFPPGES
jgi:hypothetical protein